MAQRLKAQKARKSPCVHRLPFYITSFNRTQKVIQKTPTVEVFVDITFDYASSFKAPFSLGSPCQASKASLHPEVEGRSCRNPATRKSAIVWHPVGSKQITREGSFYMEALASIDQEPWSTLAIACWFKDLKTRCSGQSPFQKGLKLSLFGCRSIHGVPASLIQC